MNGRHIHHLVPGILILLGRRLWFGLCEFGTGSDISGRQKQRRIAARAEFTQPTITTASRIRIPGTRWWMWRPFMDDVVKGGIWCRMQKTMPRTMANVRKKLTDARNSRRADGRRYARAEVNRGECDEAALATARSLPAESGKEFQLRSSAWDIKHRPRHRQQMVRA